MSLESSSRVRCRRGIEVPGSHISGVKDEFVILKCARKSKDTLQVTAAQMKQRCPQNAGWLPSRDGNITVQLKGTTSPCHRTEQVFPAEKQEPRIKIPLQSPRNTGISDAVIEQLHFPQRQNATMKTRALTALLWFQHS